MKFSTGIAAAALVSLPITAALAEAQSIDAATIYAETCSVCHGDDGRGAVWGQASLATPPPPSIRTETLHPGSMP